MIMSAAYPTAAPYSTGPCANYPTVWYGGPVPLSASGPARKVRPRRRRGLGDGCMSYSDILNSIGGGSAGCDPRDSACVMAGTQRANAAEDAIASSSCVPVGTPISFTVDTSPAAMNAFMNNTPIAQPVTVGGTVVTEVPTGGVNTAFSQAQAAVTNPPPPAPPQKVVNPSPQTQQTTTGSSTTAPGSAVNVANGTTATTQTSSDLVSTVQGYISDLTGGTEIISGVPNWALLAGGGLAVLLVVNMFSQHRR